MWGYFVSIVVMDNNASGGMAALRGGRTRAVEKACNDPRKGHHGDNLKEYFSRIATSHNLSLVFERKKYAVHVRVHCSRSA
jgi:hypothetical protein